ncbi:MAG: hydroxymethylbilane synthase [Gemmatimonadales bacterium]|nr:hydroxymethylbilane synthase [Gemmatimonadales bacterium]
MTNPTPAGPEKRALRIGTRGSELALWQAHTVQRLLKEQGIGTEIEIIKTRGDRIDDVPFSKLEGKGFFTKELEDAQLEGRVDFAVHSLKDLTTEEPPGLTLAAMIGREDPREILLARPGAIDEEKLKAGEILPLIQGANLGTSAARRQAQAHLLRPDLEILDLRGNVPTRVQKLRDGKYDAILLARAGILRLELKLDDLAAIPLDVDRFVPPPAQGMLGIQCRDEAILVKTLQSLHCPVDGSAVGAERLLLQRLDGGCQLPFGVNIRSRDNDWKLELFLAENSEGGSALRLCLTGDSPLAVAEQAWQKVQKHKRSLR